MANSNPNQQSLQCPNCNSLIYFSAQELIKGTAFSCARCNMQIRLSPESRNEAEKAYDKFNDLKNKLKDRQ